MEFNVNLTILNRDNNHSQHGYDGCVESVLVSNVRGPRTNS